MTSYPETEISRVRRMHERGSHSEADVHAILDAGLIAHVGYVIDGRPYVTPTSYWRIGGRLYWHGSSASRMLRSVREKMPVCVTVTHFDGLVIARSGYHHSANYRTVMAFGHAEQVADEDKADVLDAFIDRFMPGRSRIVRPVDAQEMKATMVIGMTIEEASAKVRAGPPVDDEADYALPIWAGVVPVRQVVGAPMADPKLKPGIAPGPDLAAYREGRQLDALLREAADGSLAHAAE